MVAAIRDCCAERCTGKAAYHNAGTGFPAPEVIARAVGTVAVAVPAITRARIAVTVAIPGVAIAVAITAVRIAIAVWGVAAIIAVRVTDRDDGSNSRIVAI